MTENKDMPVLIGFQTKWLTENGWVQARDRTWCYPNSTCRYVSTETAYQIGKLIVESDK